MNAKTITIYVDADACPVKAEIYRVAERYGVKVFVVSNSMMAIPRDPMIERVIVSDGFDAADDWIAERVSRGDVVVTADIPLASRCVKAGADAISPTGRAFTEASIGNALATRNLMDELRSAGQITGGPRPFSPKDRSSFSFRSRPRYCAFETCGLHHLRVMRIGAMRFLALTERVAGSTRAQQSYLRAARAPKSEL